jgi:hypothetical protein
MPFKSEQQRKLMWSKHPAIARRWAKKYGNVPVNRGAGVGQVANQAKQKKKPVQPQEDYNTQRGIGTVPVVAGKQAQRKEQYKKSRDVVKSPPSVSTPTPPIGRRTPPSVTSSTSPKPPRPIAPGQKWTPEDKQRLSDTINRFKNFKPTRPAPTLNRTQLQQRKGMLPYNVGGPQQKYIPEKNK